MRNTIYDIQAAAEREGVTISVIKLSKEHFEEMLKDEDKGKDLEQLALPTPYGILYVEVIK